MTDHELITQESRELLAPMMAHQLKQHVHMIREVMQNVMIEDRHYGIIPGTEKPTLYKPGAELLCMMFRLGPGDPVIHRRELPLNHLDIEVRLPLYHIHTGECYGWGIGSCSTMESKYRYRQGERVCPNCGKATIIKGKAEFGGGWLCFAKKGGCGTKFPDTDEAITSQQIGRVENPDIADLYNTVLKIGKKRALIDVTLVTTAASDIFTSDIFTQDLEDMETPPSSSGRLITPPKPERKPTGNRQAEAFEFQPGERYIGIIAGLTQSPRANVPGSITLNTEKGPLQVYFFETPSALQDYERPWKELIGMTAVVSFVIEAPANAKKWRKLAMLELATAENRSELEAGLDGMNA